MLCSFRFVHPRVLVQHVLRQHQCRRLAILADECQEVLQPASHFAIDRFGVRPLYYAEPRGDLVFASEAKAIFASGDVTPQPDPLGLDEVFSFWSARAPRTVFAGVSQLPPGCWALWRNGQLTVSRYWAPEYEQQQLEPADAIEQLDDILRSFSVPVVFVTAFPEKLTTGTGPEPTFLIPKPFREEAVKAIVSQVLFFDQQARQGLN